MQERNTPSHWSAWMWGSIIVIAFIDVTWIALTPIRLAPSSVITIAGIAITVGLATQAERKWSGTPRVRSLITGCAMLFAAWPSLRLYNHLTMSVPIPLADAKLAALDRMIGFDWLGYIKWLDQHPNLTQVMSIVYGGLTAYSIILFLILTLCKDPERYCAEFLKLFLTTAIICTTIGMLFPALSAIVYYNPPADSFHFITGRPGTYHLQELYRLRTDAHVVLDMHSLPGLVTFPSFHTAMGVIAIYCARHTWALFAASTAINLTMIASTPLFGAHYGIDVVAGTAVAVICIALLRLADARRAAGSHPDQHLAGRTVEASA